MTISARIKVFLLTVRLRRLLLRGGLAVLFCLVLAAALVAALPTLVSSPFAQSHLRRTVSNLLKRQVSWSSLSMSWSEGLSIRELALGSGPAPLLKGKVDQTAIVPKIGYTNGRMRIDLELRIRTVTAELAPGAPKPPEPYREPLTAIAEALQRFEKMDWPLPLDLGAQVTIEPVNLVYVDPETGRKLTLDNFVLRFSMPSLADQPVTAELRGDMAVDGHRLEALTLTADLRRLVTATRHIRPAVALVAIKAALPGATLTMQGGLHEPGGFTARAGLDIPRLMAVAGPLLPSAVPHVAGELLLDLRARADDLRNLHAHLALGGTRLALSGGRLRQGRIGPLDLRLAQNIITDHQRQQVRFSDGSVTIGTLLTGSWDATVDRPSSPDRNLTARLGPVRVDLRQAVAVAAPLLPPRFPVREITGELTLQQLSARLQGRKHQGEATLAGLGVSLPRLRLALATGGVAAEGIIITIDQASVSLAAFKPANVDAALSYAVQKCAVTGDRPLSAEGLRGNLQMAIRVPELKDSLPRRITASIDLKQSLDLQRVNLERQLDVTAVHEQLAARINAKENGEIEMSLPELNVSVAALKAVADGKELKPFPLAAVFSADGIRLPATRGGGPTVDRATCTLTGGDYLRLTATGALTGSAPRMVTTKGSLDVNLERILPLAAPFLPKGVAAAGVTTLAWNLTAPVGQQTTVREKNLLQVAKAALARIEQADITLALANRAITWPLAYDRIKIGELRTSQPFQLTLPGKDGIIRVAGDFAFTGLSGLPGKAGQLSAQNGSLLLHGEMADWQILRLHEELQIQPLGLTQRADATISRIDALLEQKSITTATLLQRLDAALAADITAKFPAAPTAVPGGVELSGTGNAGLRLNLAAGRDLRVQATATTRDFGLRLRNGTSVEGLRADLLIDRTYALAKGEAGSWTPLSASLVRPAPEQAAVGAAEIVNRVREDLRGQERGSRKFTIRRIIANNGKTPIELTSLEGDLLLTPEEIGLSFFQAEMLGGTVRLHGLIDLKSEVPTVSAACSFSNLETFLLLSPEARKQSGKLRQDTEITGEASIDAPLVMGQRELLEGIRMRLNLRKIGADTLERALFGLDPFERNEQLVAQRKMLRQGKLKGLRAGTLDGAFSLDGEIQVKGVDLALPQVERIRLADLPIRKQMAGIVTGVASLRNVLDLVRADTLVVGPQGKIELIRRGHE
ncbi:MAG: hypothetical protein WCP20_07530 [Desulfuromonadales bacterium]